MPGPLVSITETLAVSAVTRMRGLEAFRSSHLWTPMGGRGVFGGQVIAQSIMAASATVKGKDLHSQHCYFLLPANSQVPITFTVERLRDGKSYSTRLVHALQDSKTVFILMASFTSPPRAIPTDEASSDPQYKNKNEDDPPITHSLKFDLPHTGQSVVPKASFDARAFSPTYQVEFPKDITPWNQCTVEEETWSKFLSAVKDKGVDLGKRTRAVQNYIDEREQSPVSIAIARQQAGKYGTSRAIWIKPRLRTGEVLDHGQLRALFAFMTDFQFIGTGARAIGLSGNSRPRLGMMASLDHTTHYYPLPKDISTEGPFLHVMEAVAVDVGAGRGLVRGLVYTENGTLVATTSQEGVIRADFGEGIRPTRETDRNAKL